MLIDIPSASISKSMAEAKIALKLLVDKEKNKVIFAECDRDFVDVLCSFLTLPMGTIIRLCNKKSELGSMDALYQSVEETLDSECFQTEACRSMLLRPKSAVQNKYRNLVVNVDDSTEDQVNYYRCPSWTCCTETRQLMSMFENAKCICGKPMDRRVVFEKLNIDEKDKLAGMFVKGIRKFTISDDLQVKCVSAKTSFSLLSSLDDRTSVEEKLVTVGAQELVDLLNCSLLSMTPMTDVFLLEKITDSNVIKKQHKIKSEPHESHCATKTISLDIWIKKSDNKVLCAVADEQFLEFLLSFLTLPVGAIVKLLGGNSCLGCVDNLYKSMGDLCNENPEKLSDYKDMLLNPKIACHHGCGNQILQMGVEESHPVSILKCSDCFEKGENECKHGQGRVSLSLLNPKRCDATTEDGKGFVKESTMYMVTDELLVEPLSPISTITFVKKLGVSAKDLDERTVTVGEKEALSILKASISSKTVLTDVFYQKL